MYSKRSAAQRAFLVSSKIPVISIVGFRGRGGICGGYGFLGGIKGREGLPFSVKWWGIPIFQQGRKKTLEIRAILCTLGVQKAQQLLVRAI
jgi:hypothetical protein